MGAPRQTAPARPILALVYSDGIAADRFLADLGYRLRDCGIAVAGVVQHNRFVRDRNKCDMVVEDLASGTILQLSEYRGKEARGCVMDRSALLDVAVLVSAALRSAPRLVILNKFGKIEAEGRGLRDVIADAAQLGIPIMVGVPYRNLEQWRRFADGLSEECVLGDSRVDRWLLLHGFSELPIACQTSSEGTRPVASSTDILCVAEFARDPATS